MFAGIVGIGNQEIMILDEDGKIRLTWQEYFWMFCDICGNHKCNNNVESIDNCSKSQKFIDRREH